MKGNECLTKGIKLSIEHRLKLSDSAKKPERILIAISNLPIDVRKEKNPFWKGGISKTYKSERQLLMETKEYKDWRTNVFRRDNYTCQECGSRGYKLNADHIKPFAFYPELRLIINNGRTLCVFCHRKTETYGWKVYNKNTAPAPNGGSVVSGGLPVTAQ